MYICTFLVSSASCGPVCVPSLIRVCRGIEREEGFSSRAQFVSHYVIGFAVVWRVAAAWFRGREGGGCREFSPADNSRWALFLLR